MHELPVTESIIKIASEEATKHQVKRVKEIKIKVGELTGLIPDTIQYYFDIASKGTKVEGAKLTIAKIPIQIRCNQCKTEQAIQKGMYCCPTCEGYDIKIIGGNEFLIDSLEVE